MSKTENKLSSLMKYVKNIIFLCVLGLIVGVLLGYLGALHPALDTFSHFRLHAGVGLVLCVIILVRFKWFIVAIPTLLIGCMAIYTSASGTVFSATPLKPDTSKPVYSLLHFNVYWINKQREAVIDRIIELDPDLISLTEAASRWTRHINRLDEKWPYLSHCAESGKRGGVRFYSKWPLDKSDEYCGPYGSFAKTDVISPEGIKFTSGSVHLRWPWPASGPEQLQTITPQLNKIGDNALLAGDFNAVTWSHALKHFAAASNMQIVKGIGSTWMIDLLPLKYTWWAGLPIDNVLQKGNVRVLSATTLEDMGSDHLPVLVKFQLQK